MNLCVSILQIWLVLAQSLPLGGIPVGSLTPTTVTYASNFCQTSGSSPVGCLLNSTPTAGQAVEISYMFFGTSLTISSVSDGGSTYVQEGTYLNGTSFGSGMIYTCNYAGSSSTVTLTFTGPSTLYLSGVVATGNRTSGCVDGYNKAQGTSTGTAWTSGTVTTTNPHDMLIGSGTNDCASSGLTAGVDGQGNSYTLRASNANAIGVETLNEVATNTYSASMTGPSCIWNMEVMAIR